MEPKRRFTLVPDAFDQVNYLHNEGLFVLEDSLIRYCSSGFSRFHVPGHKGSFSLDFSYDVTELDCTDDLYNSNGRIKRSECIISELYGSSFSLFSTQGNTLCIQTMISLVASSGDKIIVARNCHESVVNSMALLGVVPIWVDYDENGNVSHLSIAEKLNENPDVCGIFITSPDYFGSIANIKAIKSISRNIPVLVDNSHGSHLIFFEMHPISLGADLCADSAHKTLPVLTGGAWLHIGNEFSRKFDIDYQYAKQKMKMFASTSPSFLSLVSLEQCAKWMKNDGKKQFLSLRNKVEEVKHNAKKIVFKPHIDDPVRLTFDTSSIGYSSEEFIKHLELFEIKPEFGIENKTVLIPSPFNSDEDWIKLENAIRNIKPKRATFRDSYKNSVRKSVVLIREAMLSKSEKVPLNDCEGRVSAQIVSNYPPGIPIILPGDIIDSEVLKLLRNMKIEYLRVMK